MNQLKLEEIKQIEFSILKEFKSFCENNDITFYLSNGTLLGAAKYKGFIPWDDDVDVFVPRKDYNRLMEIYQDSERYRLFSYEREKEFRFPFAKLCDMRTIKEEPVNNGVKLGLDIDIFPLDSWSEEYSKALREVKKATKNYRWLSFAKLQNANAANPVKRFIKAIVLLLVKAVGWRYFLKNMIKEATSDAKKESCFLGCKVWPIYGVREIIPATVFENTVTVEFEGEVFPAPVGYDTYLRSLYGNYELDPPPEKQKTHHSFIAYQV